MLLGWVLGFLGSGQDRIFGSSSREGHTLRTVRLNVKFSVRSAPPAVATHIGAAGRNLELLLETSKAGQEKLFLLFFLTRATNYTRHLFFCPQIVLNKHQVGLGIIIFFFLQKHSS